MTGPTDTSTGPDDPAYHEAVGRAIRVLRTERGMERKELAAASGLSYAYLSEIETGRKRASSKALFVIAEALGLRPSELLALGDRYAERDASGPSVVMQQPMPEPSARPSREPDPPPPTAAAPAPPAQGAGRHRWRWFERDVERAAGSAPPPAAELVAAPMASEEPEPFARSADVPPGRTELVDRLVAAGARLEDDDLAALVDVAERLGRDRTGPEDGATR